VAALDQRNHAEGDERSRVWGSVWKAVMATRKKARVHGTHSKY